MTGGDESDAGAIGELTRRLEESQKKNEKLKKYIANLELDGDRLSRELTIANSYRTFIDSISSPVFMTNEALEVTYANGAFLNLTGLSADVVQKKLKCADVMGCGEQCLLRECFDTKQMIKGAKRSFHSATGRNYALTAEALPVLDLATGAVLGGIEVFSELVEDTQLQLLVFSLSGCDFGFDLRRVKRIITPLPVVPVPNQPDTILGVVDHRGETLTLLNMHSLLGLERPQVNPATQSIIVLESKIDDRTATYGVLVDEVTSMVTICSTQIDKFPSLTSGATNEFVQGIAKIASGCCVVVDVSDVMRQGDLVAN